MNNKRKMKKKCTKQKLTISDVTKNNKKHAKNIAQ
jgi:hypothetical protein